MNNITKALSILFISLFYLSSLAQTRHFPTTKPIGIEGVLISEKGDTLKFNYTLDSAAIAQRDSALILIPNDSNIIKNRPKRMHDSSQLDTMLNSLKNGNSTIDSICIDSLSLDSLSLDSAYNDSTITTIPSIESDTTHYMLPNPFMNTAITDSASLTQSQYSSWISREANLSNQYSPVNSNSSDINKTKYNIDVKPKLILNTNKIDPSKSRLSVKEQNVDSISVVGNTEIKRRNWLHSFNGSLQFSQAYISPNWYQGGNNNLNMLLNTEFNIKLNEKFHPNLLFETSVKYKLGMNSAPEDTLRNYSISEDLFQLNSKFGVRAAKRWFYSVQLQFKTQIFNGYKSNSNDLKASFLSPGELNVGLGMTYNYANKKNTFTFDASISPLSYNLKSCINSRMHETDFGITAGKKTVSDIGSSGEGKLKWQIAHNISLSSRLFVFTDYKYFQGDLENTLSFAINRFLSTQINVNMRYDSSSPRIADSKWHKFQLKEILSFGFSYSFKNL